MRAAFAEYGRIDKTTHLLALVDPVDDTYRRLMNRQLTVQESATGSPARSATGAGARSARRTARARRTSLPPWAWFSTRHLFNIRASGPGQGLRPFRDPKDEEDDEALG
ncbi:hypothetical protein AMK28_24905 [Streptomyces sp. CB02115]|nr:hypothetical protein AMK28_24905 [Streptomyces sp. CB02115]